MRSEPSPKPRGKLLVGVFGGAGSFTEEAGLAFAARERLRYDLLRRGCIQELLQALEQGAVDICIVPVVNTRGGLVQATFEAMGRRRFQPIGEIHLDVRQCLLVRSEDVVLRDLRRVASHPQALAQCQGFLDHQLPDAERVVASDTADAARALAAGEWTPDTAVLASRRAAAVTGLHVLREDVNDDPNNRTTFVALRRDAA